MNSTFCKIAVIVTFLAHVATSRPQSQRTLVGGFIPIVSTGVRFPGETILLFLKSRNRSLIQGFVANHFIKLAIVVHLVEMSG